MPAPPDRGTVSLIDTGPGMRTGGRLRRIRLYLDGDDVCMTYGYGLADIAALIALHKSHGTSATVTAVAPRPRFGALSADGDVATRFEEKPHEPHQMVSGGFFVLSQSALDLVAGDDTIWEREPMERLVRDGELMVHRHYGFWQPMDMLRDKLLLEELWAGGRAPWLHW